MPDLVRVISPKADKQLNKKLSQDFVRTLFEYDASSGIVTRKIDSGKTKAGSIVGRLNKDGYLVVGISGGHYFVHRIIWMHVFGVDPDGQIDHINAIKTDNRLANLRDVDQSTNMKNIYRANKNNSHGYRGVSACGGLFQARIQANGKLHSVGCFKTPEIAHEAYLKAKQLLHA